MAQNKNETTTKYKADVSNLVNGMQTARRQIALANAEFKAGTAGMDDWSSSADGVGKKIEQLKTNLTAQSKILENLESQYELTAKQMGTDSKEAENLRIKIENQKASIAKTEKELKKYTESLNNIKAQSSQSATAIDKLSDTIKTQEDKLKDIKSAYANATLEYGKNSKEAKNLASQIDKLSAELAKNKKTMNEASRSADDLDNSLDNATDSAEQATSGFTVFKGAIASLVADGIKSAISKIKELASSTSQASNTFQSATGATSAAMKGYNKAIQSVYKNNFGESLQDVAEKMLKVKEITKEVDPSKLQELTENAIALEDTFGMDITETLRGVKALMTHFGLTAKEAFDLISSGAQNGLNYTDELGDNVSEYAGKFAEAGYSAEEYFQLLKNGAEGGAYNLDKVNDAINEATTRLGDGTIADTMAAIDEETGKLKEGTGIWSKETEKAFKAWQTGQGTQKAVIASIVKDIQEATSEQEKMNLAATAFGTMAEDGGTKFIESLSAIGNSFNDVKGKMDEIKEQRYDDVVSQLSGLGRTVQLEILTPIVEKALPVIKKGITWITENIEKAIPIVTALGVAMGGVFVANKIANFIKSIQIISGVFKAWSLATKVQAAAQAMLNVVLNANPIGLIIAAVAALIAIFATLWNKCEGFREFFKKLGNVLVKVFQGAVDLIKKIFTGIIDWFKNNWKSILLLLVNPFAGAFKLLYDNCKGFREFFNKLGKAIVKAFQSAAEFIKKIFLGIVDWFKNNWKSILLLLVNPFAGAFKLLYDNCEGFRNFVNRIVNSIKEFFASLGQKIAEIIQNIGTFFVNLWNGIVEGAKKVVQGIINIFVSIPSWIYNNIIAPIDRLLAKLWNGFLNGAKRAWEGVKSVFSKVADFFGNIFSKAWEKVKAVFSVGGKIFDGIKDGIVTAFKAIVNAIIKGINKVVSLPFKAINKVLNALREVEILGYNPFDFIHTIDVPQIPELYKGGVLKKGQVGYLEGNGDEAVVPLQHNTGWLDEVARRIVAKGGLVGGKTQTINNSYNYEFNQTNNSPRALDRLEIYRQTRNLTTYRMETI